MFNHCHLNTANWCCTLMQYIHVHGGSVCSRNVLYFIDWGCTFQTFCTSPIWPKQLEGCKFGLK